MAHSEPDNDRDEPAFRAPLPVDDRLWRHPSELGTDADERSEVSRLLSMLFPARRP